MSTIPNHNQYKNIGIAGLGAIGSAVMHALTSEDGINEMQLECISDPYTQNHFDVDNVSFEELAERCDLIIECLPADVVPDLAKIVFKAGKDILFISSAALLIDPQILKNLHRSESRAYLPSGALCGLDGVVGMREMGITSSTITSTKPPKGFAGAPYVIENDIGLDAITEKTQIFEGDAYDAAKGFPANVNVAATLSLAGIPAHQTRVEIWADPKAKGNTHEITVKSNYSTLVSRIENLPDPANIKSSSLAAQSIVATLRNMGSKLAIY
ncbi:MAG: DUF108 domain-containing protein [Alphaproteobacteria bacterium]|nr:DUF108 domain-containing protein [Alphaproteobacteria bacterium]